MSPYVHFVFPLLEVMIEKLLFKLPILCCLPELLDLSCFFINLLISAMWQTKAVVTCKHFKCFTNVLCFILHAPTSKTFPKMLLALNISANVFDTVMYAK